METIEQIGTHEAPPPSTNIRELELFAVRYGIWIIIALLLLLKPKKKK